MTRTMPRKRPPKAKTEHITGHWVLADAPYYHICCECQLAHYVDLKIEDGKLYMKWDPAPMETANQKRIARKSFDK